MAEKRIMLLGANGQVGQALRAERLPDDWRLGAYGHADLDITGHHLMQAAMRDFRPDIIINSAAFTAVDEAEKNPDLAMAVNFEAVANLAAQASAMDIPVIHLSTDYVFDGHDDNVPYKPESGMNPLNAYGESKMMGEEALRHGHIWHAILRVSSVFSAYAKNLLTAMLAAIDERDEIRAVTDMKTCPTYAPDIAKAIVAIAGGILKGKPDGFGVFHLCGTPAATRLDFTQAIMEAYAPYTARRPKILPATVAGFPGRAARPSYSVLDCEKIRTVYGIEQKDWREGLRQAITKLAGERSQPVQKQVTG